MQEQEKVPELPAPSDALDLGQGGEVVEEIGDLDLHESGQWIKAGLGEMRLYDASQGQRCCCDQPSID